jgi:hypothetical protein
MPAATAAATILASKARVGKGKKACKPASMARYSRMLLHAAYGLANPANKQLRPAIGSFVFGTRLTPITRLLKQRDPRSDAGGLVAPCARLVGRHQPQRLPA